MDSDSDRELFYTQNKFRLSDEDENVNSTQDAVDLIFQSENLYQLESVPEMKDMLQVPLVTLANFLQRIDGLSICLKW